jgi:hypothetical protein
MKRALAVSVQRPAKQLYVGWIATHVLSDLVQACTQSYKKSSSNTAQYKWLLPQLIVPSSLIAAVSFSHIAPPDTCGPFKSQLHSNDWFLHIRWSALFWVPQQHMYVSILTNWIPLNFWGMILQLSCRTWGQRALVFHTDIIILCRCIPYQVPRLEVLQLCTVNISMSYTDHPEI